MNISNINDVLFGAIIGAVLSSLGFILKQIVDKIFEKHKLKKEISILCELFNIAYDNNDKEKCQGLLTEIFSKSALRYRKYDGELFKKVFRISYQSEISENIKQLVEFIKYNRL